MTPSAPATGPAPRMFSVVVPVFGNEPSLQLLYERFAEQAAARPAVAHEFVFVDDGSADRSFAVLAELAARDPRVRVVRLTRNFGSHSACLAGLSVARGDCAALISADLQDPPDLPWRMLDRWGPATPVVVATRRSRDDPPQRVLFARLYYRLMRRLAFPALPRDGFDCFLVDRRVITEITTWHETNTSLTGLVLWTGFAFAQIEYDRGRRPYGRSGWTLAKRGKLFIDSVVAFSYAPLRVTSAAGIAIGVLGFAYAAVVVARRLVAGVEIMGWSSLMAAIMVLSGVQLIALGVLGEYVWRALDAARRRPSYLIAETRNVEPPAAGPSSHGEGGEG